MTKTGTVGTFGGIKLPTVAVFMDGFSDGIDKYNEDNGTDVKLLGWDKAKQDGLFAGKFDSPTDGKNLAKNLIQQGADIILPVAGSTGLGAAAEAQASGGKASVIWVDQDGYESASQYKEVFLTTVEKKIANAVEKSTTDTVNGKYSNTPVHRHAGQRRRRPGPVPRLRVEGPGRAEHQDRGAQGADHRRHHQGRVGELAPGQLTLPDRSTKPPARSAGGLRRVPGESWRIAEG